MKTKWVITIEPCDKGVNVNWKVYTKNKLVYRKNVPPCNIFHVKELAILLDSVVKANMPQAIPAPKETGSSIPIKSKVEEKANG